MDCTLVEANIVERVSLEFDCRCVGFVLCMWIGNEQIYIARNEVVWVVLNVPEIEQRRLGDF